MAVHSEGRKEHPLPMAAAQAEVAPASLQQVVATAVAEPLASQQGVAAAAVPLASQQEVAEAKTAVGLLASQQLAEAVPDLQQGAAAHLACRERA